MSALVSIIIPTHNRSAELRRALRSVIQQTYTTWEVWVCDDASTEDLKMVLQDLGDSRFQLIRNDVKSNANVMRNRGIDAARGEYIAFLDSDDEWTPDHLEVKLQLLLQTAADGAYGSSRIFDGTDYKTVISKSIGKNQTAIEFLLGGGAAPIPTWLVRTSAAKAIRFDETLKRHQDYEFFVRFAKVYRWVVCESTTLIIHWQKGQERARHAESEIAFVSRYRAELSPAVWKRYHLDHFGYYHQRQANAEVLSHYRKESLRYADQLTFLDFASLHPNRKGAVGFVLNLFGLITALIRQRF